jgi:hypothetical protein
MADFNSLPEELLVMVATNLDQPDLPNLARVWRKSRHAAEEVLYKAPRIGAHLNNPWVVRRLRRFAETLLRRPDLAQHVRELEMVTAPGDGKSDTLPVSQIEDAVAVVRTVGEYNPL